MDDFTLKLEFTGHILDRYFRIAVKEYSLDYIFGDVIGDLNKLSQVVR